ncbi:MAG: hypothetical protein AAB478_01380 [Patescibacteria group bacterium]
MRTTIIFVSCLAVSLIIAFSLIYVKRSLSRPVLGTQDKSETISMYTSSRFRFRFPYPSGYHIREENNGRTIYVNENFSSSPSAAIQIIPTDILFPTQSLLKNAQVICSGGEAGSCSQIESQSVVTNIHGATGIIYYFRQQPDKKADGNRVVVGNKGPFYAYRLSGDRDYIGFLLFTPVPDRNKLLTFITDGLEIYSPPSISSNVSQSPIRNALQASSSAQQGK